MAKRDISGVLLLDKPYGITSNKALQSVKYLYAAVKSGHTGTLDPMATGLLPICMGEATKFSSILLNASKAYEAVLKLGYRSTTGDVEGEIEKLLDFETVRPTIHDCEKVLQQFVGEITQIPPMYSALKHQGKSLYLYARKGQTIERKPRTVLIHEIKAESLIEDELRIVVRCGTGTYIRTLAEDIGQAMGLGGAYLLNLRRYSIGSFDISQSSTLETLEDMSIVGRDDCLLPIDSLLLDFPMITLDKKEAQYILQGRVISVKSSSNDLFSQNNHAIIVRLYYRQQFLGLGEVSKDFELKPKRLMSDAYLIDQNALLLN